MTNNDLLIQLKNSEMINYEFEDFSFKSNNKP